MPAPNIRTAPSSRICWRRYDEWERVMSEATAKGSVIWATGRRKNAVAQVRLTPGEGRLWVNQRSLDQYFGALNRQKAEVLQPLKISGDPRTLDVFVRVTGGGITGQAEAIRHGLTRALTQWDPKLRTTFRKEGLLTRDPRMVERKKPGQPKARKRFQFSKR